MSGRGWGKGEFLSPTNTVMCTAIQVSAAIKLFMHGSVPSSGDLTVPSSLIFSSMPIKVCYSSWSRGLTLISLNLEQTLEYHVDGIQVNFLDFELLISLLSEENYSLDQNLLSSELVCTSMQRVCMNSKDCSKNW